MNSIRNPMAAVVLSTFALGLSCWAIACGSTGASAPSPVPPCTAPVETAAAQPVASALAASDAPVEERSAARDDARLDTHKTSREALAKAELRINRLVLARSVKGREPVVPLTQVAAGVEPLYAFVEVENRSAHNGAIVISFEKAGTRTGNIELKVPAAQDRWRTWGYSRGVREPGAWSVVVRSVGGRELARTAFEAS